MRAEVVAIGTELLLGQIIDTNSAWIGEQLASAGIDCHRQVKVGDNLDRIVAAISEALDGNDAVICCGGLGPTQDDLTRRAIAAGEVLRAPAVGAPPMVTAGRSVAVIYQDGPVRIYLTGVATNSAPYGSAVGVRIDPTRRLDGIAVAPNTVRLR